MLVQRGNQGAQDALEVGKLVRADAAFPVVFDLLHGLAGAADCLHAALYSVDRDALIGMFPTRVYGSIVYVIAIASPWLSPRWGEIAHNQEANPVARIYTSATIACPIEALYDYVTTPAHWPEWHPSSLGVSEGAEHSLLLGEQVTERFLVAGRRGTVIWTVTEREEPRRWVIIGTITGTTGGGTITYTLNQRPDGVFFEREFVYPPPNLLFTVLDALILRRRVQAESEEATRRLKAKMEERG